MENHPLNKFGEAIVNRLPERMPDLQISKAGVLQNETATGTINKQQRINKNAILVCTVTSPRYVGSWYAPAERAILQFQIQDARCKDTKGKGQRMFHHINPGLPKETHR